MKKYRNQILIFSILIFTYLTVRSIYQFVNDIDRGMSFIGCIAYGIGVIMYFADLYAYHKNKKRINS